MHLPRRIRPERPEGDERTRWKSLLAAPLELPDDVSLVVGSIVIASMEPPDESQLSAGKKALRRRCSPLAQQRGEKSLPVEPAAGWSGCQGQAC